MTIAADKLSIHREHMDGPVQGRGRAKIPFVPTPENPLILSTTELSDFLRCRLKWNWRYRRGIKARTVGREQGIGIVCHEGRDQWYQLSEKRRTLKRMMKISRRLIGKNEVELERKERMLAKAMLDGYAEWALGDHDESDEAIGLRSAKLFPEELFLFPLVKDRSILIRGKIDLRFEPTNKKRTLAIDEAKTRGHISFDALDLNHQLSTYLAALRHLYPNYRRYVAWRTVWRRAMPGPRIKRALFAREQVERSDEEIEMWLTDTRRQAREILDAAIYPTQTDSCKWDCEFYNLCLVRSDKATLKDLIHSEFVSP